MSNRRPANLQIFKDLEPKSRIWGPYGRQGCPQTSPGAFEGVWGRLGAFLTITRIFHTCSMKFSHIRPLLHRFCLTETLLCYTLEDMRQKVPKSEISDFEHFFSASSRRVRELSCGFRAVLGVIKNVWYRFFIFLRVLELQSHQHGENREIPLLGASLL